MMPSGGAAAIYPRGRSVRAIRRLETDSGRSALDGRATAVTERRRWIACLAPLTRTPVTKSSVRFPKQGSDRTRSRPISDTCQSGGQSSLQAIAGQIMTATAVVRVATFG